MYLRWKINSTQIIAKIVEKHLPLSLVNLWRTSQWSNASARWMIAQTLRAISTIVTDFNGRCISIVKGCVEKNIWNITLSMICLSCDNDFNFHQIITYIKLPSKNWIKNNSGGSSVRLESPQKNKFPGIQAVFNNSITRVTTL